MEPSPQDVEHKGPDVTKHRTCLGVEVHVSIVYVFQHMTHAKRSSAYAQSEQWNIISHSDEAIDSLSESELSSTLDCIGPSTL